MDEWAQYHAILDIKRFLVEHKHPRDLLESIQEISRHVRISESTSQRLFEAAEDTYINECQMKLLVRKQRDTINSLVDVMLMECADQMKDLLHFLAVHEVLTDDQICLKQQIIQSIVDIHEEHEALQRKMKQDRIGDQDEDAAIAGEYNEYRKNWRSVTHGALCSWLRRSWKSLLNVNHSED